MISGNVCTSDRSTNTSVAILFLTLSSANVSQVGHTQAQAHGDTDGYCSSSSSGGGTIPFSYLLCLQRQGNHSSRVLGHRRRCHPSCKSNITAASLFLSLMRQREIVSLSAAAAAAAVVADCQCPRVISIERNCMHAGVVHLCCVCSSDRWQAIHIRCREYIARLVHVFSSLFPHPLALLRQFASHALVPSLDAQKACILTLVHI